MGSPREQGVAFILGKVSASSRNPAFRKSPSASHSVDKSPFPLKTSESQSSSASNNPPASIIDNILKLPHER